MAKRNGKSSGWWKAAERGHDRAFETKIIRRKAKPKPPKPLKEGVVLWKRYF